jgi:glycosyltransferase involved in cell wall biosynthesis
MSIWFVTPAWQRFELTAVCLEQRHQVIKHLVSHGIDAYCVVIADDENLDTARAFGFDTVEQDNTGLGRKFNDGMEYAAKHGADWIVPIGSDSWIDPAYFLPLPTKTRTSMFYSAVEAHRLAELKVRGKGAGPYMFSRDLLKSSRFRPADDNLMRGIDGSTLRGIRSAIRWEQRNLHPLQYVGFRGKPHLTDYAKLWQKWGTQERTNPWELLAQHYDPSLVERARKAMLS